MKQKPMKKSTLRENLGRTYPRTAAAIGDDILVQEIAEEAEERAELLRKYPRLAEASHQEILATFRANAAGKLPQKVIDDYVSAMQARHREIMQG